MPSVHTHRFSWTPWKPIVSACVLFLVGLSLIAPLAVPYANAQAPATPATPAAPASTPSTEGLPTDTPAPPAVAAADSSLCSDSSGAFARVRCYFFQIIAEILLLIASLLGRILVFMVDILIAFASYNDFGGTAVVERGWVIVRDVVNMFFIVVLLVSAFATIIGYDEGNFHYKRVLPKLLLMAVLINFSKTLILLLVDFSQVMMLTFVNAFAQAGPGNLVATLQMEKVLALAPPTAGEGTDALATARASTGTIDPLNLILSIMLAIFMLSISLGVVTIMVGYLIFRIVGLWVALILSPIALFATALPGRLQKGMDNFTGKYWQRLTALITGGPVMAFFLWLTFAITQNAGDGGLAPALKFQVQNPTVTFLTTVGNSESIASFIVGITMMLMGLDAAVSSATAVSETLGAFAKKTASASKALGKLAATSPFLATYYGARTGARYADRRLDITGKAATAAAATVGQIPILRGALRKPLTEAMTKNKRLDLEEAKGLQAGLEHLTPAQRAIMAGATPSSVLATKGERMAYAQQMMERAAPKNAQAMKDQLQQTYQNQFAAMKQKELEGKGLKGDALKKGMADASREIENRASQYADRDVASRQGYFLSKAQETAKAMGDKDMERSIEEQLKKNPHLMTDPAEAAKNLMSDKGALKGISDQAAGNGALIHAIMSHEKVLEKDSAGNITGIKRAEMDALLEKAPPNLRDNLESFQKYIEGQNGAGKTVSQKELESKFMGKNEKGKPRMFNMPIKQAGKAEGVAGEFERAISALPVVGEAITGKAYGPAATLADFSGVTMEPVMHESAKRAKAALASAKSAAAASPSATNMTALRAAIAESVKQQGLKDTIENEPDTSDVMKQLMQIVKDQMSSGDFSMAASLGKDIKGLPGNQQKVFAAQFADFLAKDYPALRAAGKSAAIDKHAKNIMEVSVSIDEENEKRGISPVAGSADANIRSAVTEVRKKLNSTVEAERKEYPGAWRYIVEPKELT